MSICSPGFSVQRCIKKYQNAFKLNASLNLLPGEQSTQEKERPLDLLNRQMSVSSAPGGRCVHPTIQQTHTIRATGNPRYARRMTSRIARTWARMLRQIPAQTLCVFHTRSTEIRDGVKKALRHSSEGWEKESVREGHLHTWDSPLPSKMVVCYGGITITDLWVPGRRDSWQVAL